MKTKICAVILLLCTIAIYAQTDKDSRKVELTDGTFVVPDKFPEVTKHIKPVYPRQAILQDIQGKVYVKVTINEKGKVDAVKIAQGINSSLDKAAMTAAKKMEFSPAVYQGKPVKASIAVPVNFVLDPEKKGPNVVNSDQPEKLTDLVKRMDNQLKSIRFDIKQTDGDKKEDPDPSSFIPVEKNPEPIQLVKPEYPDLARRAGLTGLVVLRVLINTEGKPVKTVVIKVENEIFIEPAKKAAMETLFKPAIQNGKPIMCWLNIPFRFSLNKDNELGKSYFVCEIIAGSYNYYPKELSDRFIEGKVKLLVRYDSNGQMISTEFTESTNSILDQKAIEFVKEKMKPESYKNGNLKKVNGKDVYEFNYDVSFEIPKKDKYAISSKNEEYPADAKANNIQGAVEIEFTYDKEGHLLNSKYLKQTYSSLDELALKYLSNERIFPKSIKKFIPSGESEIRIVVVKEVVFQILK